MESRQKLEQKIQNITKEHKFFKDNSVCPTCGQDIEEEFRVNKVGEIEDQVQEINTAYKALKKTISDEQDREKEFAHFQPISDTTHAHFSLSLSLSLSLSPTILKSLNIKNKQEVWNLKFKRLPHKLQTEILNEMLLNC